MGGLLTGFALQLAWNIFPRCRCATLKWRRRRSRRRRGIGLESTGNSVVRTSLVAPVCVLIVLELGVDGSCAEHSTVESYTVIYAANSQSLLIIISFPSPTLSFIPDLKAFLQILPTAAFFLLLD